MSFRKREFEEKVEYILKWNLAGTRFTNLEFTELSIRKDLLWQGKKRKNGLRQATASEEEDSTLLIFEGLQDSTLIYIRASPQTRASSGDLLEGQQILKWAAGPRVICSARGKR